MPGMEFGSWVPLALIGLAALLAAGMSFFSGFGLGTLLLPVFALFFPVPLAIAATAMVHLANNLFKFGLMQRHANWPLVWRFGLPAAGAALLGASLMVWLDALPVLARYTLVGMQMEITPIQFVIGALIVAFALLEFWPRFQHMSFAPRWMPLGGVLSGFLGGLSGNQGALRTAFLLKAGLSKEAFLATGIVAAVLVDLSRLLVYGLGPLSTHWAASDDWLAPVAVLCAFLGSFLGQRLLPKVTLDSVRVGVAALMLLIGLGLMVGLI
ncbi:predicted permease [Serpentinimonas raichei]|uniref:Probable membrane transporter protein n=2 Tax=Serpentinimonas raichei TaxID=1458425 RepID=A0A060NIC4_9BURK|nr:predicted permease [Serpentinimonas raichei]